MEEISQLVEKYGITNVLNALALHFSLEAAESGQYRNLWYKFSNVLRKANNKIEKLDSKENENDRTKIIES